MHNNESMCSHPATDKTLLSALLLVWCAGSNRYGQLADATTDQHLTPIPVAGGTRFKAIASGPTAQHTLFLQVKG